MCICFRWGMSTKSRGERRFLSRQPDRTLKSDVLKDFGISSTPPSLVGESIKRTKGPFGVRQYS